MPIGNLDLVHMMEVFLFLVLFVGNFFLSIFVVIVARREGRSGFGWFLISVLTSFIVALIILACLGDTDDKRQEKIWEEEQWRKQFRD